VPQHQTRETVDPAPPPAEDEAKVATQHGGARDAKQILEAHEINTVAWDKTHDVFAVVEMDAEDLRNRNEELQRDVKIQELQGQIQKVLAELDTAAKEMRPVVLQRFGPETTRLPVVCPAFVGVIGGRGIDRVRNVIVDAEDVGEVVVPGSGCAWDGLLGCS